VVADVVAEPDKDGQERINQAPMGVLQAITGRDQPQRNLVVGANR